MSCSLATGRAAFEAGGAVTGSGASSTAVALATAGEVWISDNEANSDVVDAAEYDEGAIAPGICAEVSTGSKDSANPGAGTSKCGFDVFGGAESGGDLGIIFDECWDGAGRASLSAFFQGVDVPQSSQ